MNVTLNVTLILLMVFTLGASELAAIVVEVNPDVIFGTAEPVVVLTEVAVSPEVAVPCLAGVLTYSTVAQNVTLNVSAGMVARSENVATCVSPSRVVDTFSRVVGRNVVTNSVDKVAGVPSIEQLVAEIDGTMVLKNDQVNFAVQINNSAVSATV